MTYQIIIIIVLLLISALSIFANFYRPKFKTTEADLTVNVKDSTYQVIFADKHFGVMKVVNASFEVSDTLDPEKAKLDSIKLKTIRISGLLKYGFEAAYYDDDSKKIRFIMSHIGKEEINVFINGSPVFNKNNITEIISEVDYSNVFQRKYIRKCYDNCTLNIACLENKFFRIKYYASGIGKKRPSEGRICNVNCTHEYKQ